MWFPVDVLVFFVFLQKPQCREQRGHFRNAGHTDLAHWLSKLKGALVELVVCCRGFSLKKQISKRDGLQRDWFRVNTKNRIAETQVSFGLSRSIRRNLFNSLCRLLSQARGKTKDSPKPCVSGKVRMIVTMSLCRAFPREKGF